MLELIEVACCTVGMSIGFVVLASAIILGIGAVISSFSKSKDPEGPLDPPAV